MWVDFDTRDKAVGPEPAARPDGSGYSTRAAERAEAAREFSTASALASERTEDFGSSAERGAAFSPHQEASPDHGDRRRRSAGSAPGEGPLEGARGSVAATPTEAVRASATPPATAGFSGIDAARETAMAAFRSGRDGDPIDEMPVDAVELASAGYSAASAAAAAGAPGFLRSAAGTALSAFSSRVRDDGMDDVAPAAARVGLSERRIATRVRTWSSARARPGAPASRAQMKARELNRPPATSAAGHWTGSAGSIAAKKRAVAWAVSGPSGGSAAAGAIAAASPAVVAVIVVVLVATIVAALAMAAGSGQDDAGDDLNQVEQAVAQFFLEKGLNPVQTAAIMGNMYAESGMDPTSIEDGWSAALTSNDDVIALGSSRGHGFGICQWSSGRNAALARYAKSRGTHWSDLGTQLDFFWDHDEWSGDWGYGAYTKAAFMRCEKEGDLGRAVTIFCRGWERPGVERLEERQEAARRYYLSLTTTGQDYANATAAQRAVVDAARSTPTAGGGMCLKWVSQVFQAAGQPRVTGSTASVPYRRWCTSSNRSELRVGMIIAVDRSTTSSAGHIGIYIGDGLVMHNTGQQGTSGSVSTNTVDEWIRNHVPSGHQARWGWANGIDLSAQ